MLERPEATRRKATRAKETSNEGSVIDYVISALYFLTVFVVVQKVYMDCSRNVTQCRIPYILTLQGSYTVD